MCGEDLEGIAERVQDSTGTHEAVDAIELAHLCGLEVVYAPGDRAHVMGRRITVGRDVRLSRIHGLVAHELAHWLLDQHGMESDEGSARYLSGALMVPRRALDRALKSVGLDLEALRPLHPNASLELLARRVTALRSAAGCVFDRGAFAWRFVTPGLRGGRSPSKLERIIAERAHSTRVALSGHDACASLAIDGDWVRVVTLVAVEGSGDHVLGWLRD
jgi:hypothetical protein